jgi:hypothetical protein
MLSIALARKDHEKWHKPEPGWLVSMLNGN